MNPDNPIPSTPVISEAPLPKRRPYKIFAGLFIFILISLLGPFMLTRIYTSDEEIVASPVVVSPTQVSEKKFTSYDAPVIGKKEQYNIFLLGDSMMHALGPRGGRFTELLGAAYPGVFFEVSNYAEANQNIEKLPERLTQQVQADHDLLLDPILEGAPDLIIIESYGYNPLSHIGSIEAGIAKHNQILNEVMTTLTNKFPGTAIFFAATIAPDRLTYGAKVLKSPPDSLAAQADERIAYIKNHMEYARSHNIPLINIYEESLDESGDGDRIYINTHDDIHPSLEGIELIAEIMRDRIVEEKIFSVQ